MKQPRALFCFITVVFVLIPSSRWLWQAKRQTTLDRALIDALLHSDTRQALALVNAGANPNTLVTASPQSSLSELLKSLLQHKPSSANTSPTAFLFVCGVDCQQRDSDCNAPPKYSATVSLVQAMFLHGANLNVQTADTSSALHVAAAANQTSIAEWLLEHHANVNALRMLGWTPLLHAVENNHPNMVRLLLAHGADVNLQDSQGNTALHHAILGNVDKDIFRQLLAHEANPNLPDKFGRTAFSLAQAWNRPDIVALLNQGRKQDLRQ